MIYQIILEIQFKNMKANTQVAEMLKMLIKAYPNSVSTHQIRQETYMVDVPKRRTDLIDMGVEIISETGPLHINKFGRKIKTTLYRLPFDSYIKACKIFIKAENL